MATPRDLQYEIYGMKVYCDGTVDRSESDLLFPSLPANAKVPTQGTLTRDVVVHGGTGAWVRIFLPHSALTEKDSKLPVVMYFHGGGFVLCSAASVIFHDYCCKVAGRLKAIFVSVDYRLAPEHRLPAAFDDGFSALKWLQSQASGIQTDPWLASHADFQRCILMGHSAGGTIVAEVALRAATEGGVEPLRICGLIPVIPYFGGIERTKSEIEYGEIAEDLPLSFTDASWAASLPVGADRSHRYCTFVSEETKAVLQRVRLPRVLVVIGGQDPLHDRQVQFVDFVRQAGHDVTLLDFEGCGHDDLIFPEVTGQADLEQAYFTMERFFSEIFHLGGS